MIFVVSWRCYRVTRRSPGSSSEAFTAGREIVSTYILPPFCTRACGELVLYESGMNVTGEQIYPPGFIDRLDALLEAGDRDAVISTMFRDLVGMPQEEVEYLRSLPAWQERVKTAHTVPGELRADEVYRFDVERFGDLRVPKLMLEGSDSPAFLKAADKAVDETLPNCRPQVPRRRDDLIGRRARGRGHLRGSR
jgi:hypothetical protein